MEELTVWKQRWDALEAMMEVLQLRLTQEEVKEVKHINTLRTLLDGLHDFAKNQFAFFFDGFGQNKFVQLKKFSHNKYPADYALRITVNQIAHDVDLIQRISEQRIIAAKNQQRPLLGTLDTADRLAVAALNPVLSQQPSPVPVILTYFQKSMNVRIIPYASVILIGIPTTCMVAKRDFLAIPHEVGHYLYWYYAMTKERSVYRVQGQPSSTRTVKQFLDEKFNQDPSFENNELLREWQEEIFADIYGCIVGGPVMALSHQDLQREQTADWFIQKDRAYPFAIIRPYIYTQVLAQMRMGVASKKLSERWEAILEKERGIKTQQLESVINERLKAHWKATLRQEWRTDPLVAEMSCKVVPTFELAAFQGFVDKLIKLVLHDLRPAITTPWSHDLTEHERMEALFAQFETNLSDPKVWPMKEAQETPQKIDWQEFLIRRHYKVGLKIQGKWPDDWAKQVLTDSAHECGQPIEIPGKPWNAVADLDGWTTEGPGSPRATGG